MDGRSKGLPLVLLLLFALVEASSDSVPQSGFEKRDQVAFRRSKSDEEPQFYTGRFGKRFFIVTRRDASEKLVDPGTHEDDLPYALPGKPREGKASSEESNYHLPKRSRDLIVCRYIGFNGFYQCGIKHSEKIF